MEQLVRELKKSLPFKETTEVGDIVLIAAKEQQMFVYALVTDIQPDPSKPRDEWWFVRFKLFSVPMQEVTWTLRLPQFTGQEVFTMGGAARFIKAVDVKTSLPQPQAGKTEKSGQAKPLLKVIK